jgi:DNA-binding transcriptional ArsR family regulator
LEVALAAKGRTKRAKAGAARKGANGGVDQRLVKALSHSLREQILMILNERMASPNELSKELGEGLSQVSYHVKVLKDYECIELVKTEPRRGAVEHYYRATARPFLSDRDWHALPDSVRPGLSADLLEMCLRDAVAALEDGSFDARKDRHLSRTPVVVDEEGWAELTKALGDSLEQVIEIEARSASRLARSGADGLNAMVALMGFELSESSKRADDDSVKAVRSASAEADRSNKD